MGESTGVDRGVLRRAGTFVKGRPTPQKVGGGIAAALLASAPFGGLSSVPEPPPEPLVLDQPIMVGPFEVVIDKVVELPDLAPAVRPEPPQRVVVLDAKVTLKGERPEYGVTLSRNLFVSGGGVATLGHPSMYFVDDTTSLSRFNPGITYRTAITFTTAGPWQGESVTVRANLVEFVEESSLTLASDAWTARDEIQWQGTLPLEKKS